MIDVNVPRESAPASRVVRRPRRLLGALIGLRGSVLPGSVLPADLPAGARDDGPAPGTGLPGDVPGAGRAGGRGPVVRVVSWVVVPALVSGVGLTVALWGQDRELALSRARQRYTELYFAAPDAIRPAGSRPDGLPVAFVIRNREGRARSYRYVISFDGRVLLGGTTGRVGDSATYEVDERVALAPGSGPGRLEVRLLPSGPSIHLVVDAADP